MSVELLPGVASRSDRAQQDLPPAVELSSSAQVRAKEQREMAEHCVERLLFCRHCKTLVVDTKKAHLEAECDREHANTKLPPESARDAP